jgi:hypothetical protein
MNYKVTLTVAAIAAAAFLAIGSAIPGIQQAFASGSASSASTGDPLGTASSASGSNAFDRTSGSSSSAGAFGSRSAGGDDCQIGSARADDGGCSNAD